MPRFIKYTLWIIASLLLIVAMQTAWYEIRVWRGWSELYATAEQFGYTPDAEIVASRKCFDSSIWIPPSMECRLTVIFRTDATFTEFQQLIVNHGLGADALGHPSSSILRSYINRNRKSKFTLTIDGDISQTRSKFDELPSGNNWRLNDSAINFFDLMKMNNNIELNGSPFKQNLVMISLGVGRHSVLALLVNPDNAPYLPN